MAPPPAWSPQPDKRLHAILLARSKLAKYCARLNLPLEVQHKAEAFYERAYHANLKRKDSLRAFLTACILLACRQEKQYLYLSSTLKPIQPSITKTIEALWYLESFLDGTAARHDEITVTCKPSTGAGGLRFKNEPPVQVHLSWPERPEAIVIRDLGSHYPRLREIRGMGEVLPGITPQEGELWKETATLKDRSEEEFEPYEEVAMGDDSDWEVVEWEDEQKARINSSDKTEKTAKAKGWTGALRRGIFG